MISKQDILDRSTEWQLRADVVEKDYVLGWLLGSLGTLKSIQENWVFKGGTAIKKCYFETYRFSEDLDFTLLPDAPYTEAAIKEQLTQLARTAQELSGIRFPLELVEVRSRRNARGEITFEGKLSYIGPLEIPTPPRVIFDLANSEQLQEQPEELKPFHPYPDELPDSTVRVYSLHELLGEKLRALFERTRPRDLYDVVFILDNPEDSLRLEALREIFGRKCSSKGIAVPKSNEVLAKVNEDEELRTEWSNMLGHQLPVLPELNSLIGRLPRLLDFLESPGAVIPQIYAAAAPVHADLHLVAPAGIKYWNVGAPLEAVRFAGTNRLMIEFAYDGRVRLVEPYSLRRAESTGNLLVYGWERAAGHIKAFNVAKIHSLRVTNESFSPRYAIELSSVLPVSRSVSTHASSLRRVRSAHSGSTFRSTGPTYVFRCLVCNKQFRKSSYDATLRLHKDRSGGNCFGRSGYFIEVRY